jgi:hypothetical protein
MSEVASPREVRAYLLNNSERLPEGVVVGQRGRLSKEAKAFFEQETGQRIAEPTAAAVAE